MIKRWLLAWLTRKNILLFPKQKRIETAFGQLKNIANTIPVPFYWSDRNYVICGANVHTLDALGFRLCPEKVIGKTVYDIYPKDIANQLIANMSTVIETDQPLITNEKVFINGEFQYYNATIAPLHDNNRNIIGTYGVSMDITAEKKAEELSLENAKQIKQLHLNTIIDQKKESVAFFSRKDSITEAVLGVAHEINQSLAAITNYIGGCKRHLAVLYGETLPNEIISSLDKASLQAQRAGKILHTFKDFVCKGKINKELCNINSLIYDIDELVDRSIKKERITIEYQFAEDLPDILCDKIQITQVILNLVNNAYDAILISNTKRKRIIIKTGLYLEGKIIIKVQDFGCGIDPDKLNDIFDPFFTTKSAGTGIGLSLCYNIAQRHGGNIFVQSSHGQGSTFNLVLPLPLQ